MKVLIIMIVATISLCSCSGIKEVSFLPTSIDYISINEEIQKRPVVKPKNANIKQLIWESSNTEIASVDSVGKVKGVGAGTAIISARNKKGTSEANYSIDVRSSITYDANGKSVHINNDISRYLPGESIKIPYNNGIYSDESVDGIKLAISSWNTIPDGSGKKYFPGQSFILNTGNKDLVLYAQWGTIGGIGPGTGIIFYDKGQYIDGWRYLEASPISSIFESYWGRNKNVPGTKEGLGEGKENTRLAFEYLGSDAIAATRCNELVINNFNDWYIPSRDELELMFKNVGIVGAKPIAPGHTNTVWSSTAKGNFKLMYVRDFLVGTWAMDNQEQYSIAIVRPIRRF
jgi:hypothetical protein